MKRIFALLIALVLIALPALAEPMSYLDYTDDLLEDGSAAYNLTLRMRHDVTVNDLSEFLESVGDVRAVSFELGI